MTTSRRSAKEAAPAAAPEIPGPRIIKKYPNRRLYDTRTSSYITLVDMKGMVLESEVFEVRDAKTGEDLTRSILLQIILEEETAGMPMFSTQALAQIIRFYGHTMQGLMGAYLETNLQTFVDMQRRFADQGTRFEGQSFQPEAWSQLMGLQPPALKGLMSTYVDQSQNLFTQMQEQMQKQAANLFPTFTPHGKDGDTE